jgi:hypothetical protein
MSTLEIINSDLQAVLVGQSTTDGYFDGQTLADGKYRYGTVKFARGL